MQYDPYWPFPQYDKNGKQLLPVKVPFNPNDFEKALL
jgi:hypothetical protein